jgi:hypothetical protein
MVSFSLAANYVKACSERRFDGNLAELLLDLARLQGMLSPLSECPVKVDSRRMMPWLQGGLWNG